LIEEWKGIWVSDGYGVYQDWVHQRQTCLAHLIRSARGLAQRRAPDIAACGHAALRELQRLCHMAHSGYPFNAGHSAASMTYRESLTALSGHGQLVKLR
jgi:Transposase IS66 family